MFKKRETIMLGMFLIALMFIASRLDAVYKDSSFAAEAMPQVSASSSSRTVDYKWYSFFDVPQDPWLWQQRFAFGYGDQLISATYPVVYRWEPITGWIYFYTSARLKVVARNLPEIYIDHPEFLPYNLMGTLPAEVVGGTANLTNWYLNYTSQARSAALGITQDGYINELTGDISMDKSATMKILGITEANFLNFATWWGANAATVRSKWLTWLRSEGGYKATNGRLDVRPMTSWYLDHFLNKIDLKYSGPDKVILTVDWVTWSMEGLLARWLHESFMKGYEWWWDDFKFNATIGPTTTNVDIDTAVTWAMYMWSFNDTAYSDPVWVWEGVLGDIPEVAFKGLAPGGPWPNSPAYPYYQYDNKTRKTYYVVAPGNDYYNRNGPYDYTPSSWDLKLGETLSFDWSNILTKGRIWVYKQLPWVSPQKPINTIQKIIGYLKLDNASEPVPSWGYLPATSFSYNPAARTLSFTGPINFTDLSWNNIRNEWLRLKDSTHPNGLLPWGEPFLEFRVTNATLVGDVNEDCKVDASDLLDLSKAYGSDRLKPNWNAKCDFNMDGKVDASDLFNLSKNYGKTS